MMGAFIAYAVALGVGLGIISLAVFLMALAVGCMFWATKKFKEMMY